MKCRHTSLERIFQVCIVVEGRDSDPTLLEELEKIDNGSVPHFHGARADMHMPDESNADDKAAHGSRIQVVFNGDRRGTAESRADAVEFIHMLSDKHEKHGLKSPQEDLLLLLLESGAEFEDSEWLAPVTGALIVPPPLMTTKTKHEAALLGAMKLANAVVFNTEGAGKRTSFDMTFTPIITDANAADINQSGGNSYAAPVWNGGAIMMRLETYRNLPAQDPTLTEEWPANLELSLNLWLCADGMDQLDGLTIKRSKPMASKALTPEMVARFASAWMEPKTVDSFFYEYHKSFPEMTNLEFETLMSKARGSVGFPIDLTERCRSFIWYAKNINTDIAETLAIAGVELKQEAEKERQQAQLKEMEKKKEEQEQKEKEEKRVKAAAKKAELEAAAKKAAEEAAAAENDGRPKPKIPLRPTNLAIVRMPKQVDISYIDVSGGHQEHPHMGAKDENGEFGYIHDETALRKNPPAFNFTGEALTTACKKRNPDWRMLHEKVVVDLDAHKAAEESGKKRDKIFCLVYTIESGHPKIPAIRETWG